MDTQNPYSTPASDVAAGAAVSVDGSGGRITPRMIAELAGTKPWVRLCSILGFIGSGFMVLAGVVVAIIGVAAPTGAAMPGGAAVGLLYVLLALLYVRPSLSLFRYAASIQRLIDRGQDVDMERALAEQRSFWKFVGVLALVMLAAYALLMLVLIGFGVYSAM